MDRRGVFAVVFIFTLVSTLLVAGVCMLTGQDAVTTVIYTLTSMWIVGVVAQLLVQNLYQSIVKPIEEQRIEERRARARTEINLEEVEAIDEVNAKIKAAETKERVAASDEKALHTE